MISHMHRTCEVNVDKFCEIPLKLDLVKKIKNEHQYHFMCIGPTELSGMVIFIPESQIDDIIINNQNLIFSYDSCNFIKCISRPNDWHKCAVYKYSLLEFFQIYFEEYDNDLSVEEKDEPENFNNNQSNTVEDEINDLILCLVLIFCCYQVPFLYVLTVVITFILMCYYIYLKHKKSKFN